jgi:hypothetical protein
MDPERLTKVYKKAMSRKKKRDKFKEHLEHTELRKNRMCELLGLNRTELDELLKLVRHELGYVKI